MQKCIDSLHFVWLLLYFVINQKGDENAFSSPFLPVSSWSDGVLLLCRTSDELDINAFQFVAFESLPSQIRFDNGYQLVVYHILVCVVFVVVEVYVLECIYVKIHLVVGTETVVIYT